MSDQILAVGDRVFVTGTICLSDKPKHPAEVSDLLCEVVDITSDNYGTAICLETEATELNRLRPFLDADRDGEWTVRFISVG